MRTGDNTCDVDQCTRHVRHSSKYCGRHHGEIHYCRWNAHCNNRGKTDTCRWHTRMTNAGMRPCQYQGCTGGHDNHPFFLCDEHAENERCIRRRYAAAETTPEHPWEVAE